MDFGQSGGWPEVVGGGAEVAVGLLEAHLLIRHGVNARPPTRPVLRLDVLVLLEAGKLVEIFDQVFLVFVVLGTLLVKLNLRHVLWGDDAILGAERHGVDRSLAVAIAHLFDEGPRPGLI